MEGEEVPSDEPSSYLPTDLRFKKERDERGTNHPRELTDAESAEAARPKTVKIATGEPVTLDSSRAKTILQLPDLPAGEPSFSGWWQGVVEQHAPIIQEKARQYGTNSLVEVGRLYARAQGRDAIEQVEAIEIGCAVYAYGKIQRVIDAMLRGELPNQDSWHDLMVYSAMAQYARAFGRWP